VIKDSGHDRADVLVWKWLRGDVTTSGDLGDPTTSDSYNLCFYDESGSAAALVFRASIPAGGMCAGGPCWTKVAPGFFEYRDAQAAPDGIDRVNLRAGEPGRARVKVRGRGENLSNRSELNLPAPPLSLPLRVQLQAATGQCWEATYSAAGMLTNAIGKFSGKAD